MYNILLYMKYITHYMKHRIIILSYFEGVLLGS